MICQECEKAAATVRCTQIINDMKTEFFLCADCAEKQGLANPLSGLPEFFGKIISNILGEELSNFEIDRSSRAQETDRYCPSCKTSLAKFKRDGLLGCSQCYDVFGSELKVLLRRIHGSNRHIGNRPQPRRNKLKTEANLPALRLELKNAIHEERYERAAELRNLIRDAEINLAKSSTSSRVKKRT